MTYVYISRYFYLIHSLYRPNDMNRSGDKNHNYIGNWLTIEIYKILTTLIEYDFICIKNESHIG